MKPRTPEELLDLQAAAARRRLLAAVAGLGDELCAAVDLRGRVRRNPLGAVALAAGLGWAAGPGLARSLRSSSLLAVGLAALRRAAARRA